MRSAAGVAESENLLTRGEVAPVRPGQLGWTYGWYHFGMAMTIRIPEDLDARLQALADARHVSKHALLLEAASRMVESEERVARSREIATGVRERYAELLSRLADA